MSVVKVTTAVPSVGSFGFAGSNPFVIANESIEPASVANRTGVGMPTRFPYRSLRRTSHVIVSSAGVVWYAGRFPFSQRK